MSKLIKFEEINKSNQDVSGLKWYRYNQNNSGGYFVGPAENVWIQGYGIKDIERRFDDLDLDTSYCSYCGERWRGPFGENELTDEPEYYGEKLTELKENPWQISSSDVPFGFLVFANGDTQKITVA